MRKQPIRAAWAAILVLALPALGLAQSYFDESSGGRGELRRGGESTRLSSARVTLRNDSNRTATVQLIGAKVWTFEGVWREVGRNEYRIDLRYAYDDPNADGRIEFLVERGQIEQISLTGEAKGTRFSADFRGNLSGGSGSGGSGGTSSGDLSLNQSISGDGQLTIGRNRETVRESRFSFNRDGNFTVTIYTGRTQTLSGRYFRRTRNEFDLTIRSGLNGRFTEGQGRLTLNSDGSRVERVSIDGRSDDDNYRYDFSSRSNSVDTGFNFSVARDGRGDYSYGRDRNQITRTGVTLKRDGTFNIDFRAARNMNVTGTYSLSGSTARLNIEQVNGVRSRGSGTVALSRDRRNFDRVDVSGMTSSTAFNASFRVDNNNDRPTTGDRPATNTGISFVDNMNGKGNFDDGSDNWNPKSLRVEVRPDGTISIGVNGKTTYSFGGTYSVRGDQLSFNLNRGYGGTVSGSGTLIMSSDKKSVREIRFDGRWKDQRFGLSYSRG